MSEWACLVCESAESAVPVWEDFNEYRADEPPDYIGCTSCSRMIDPEAAV